MKYYAIAVGYNKETKEHVYNKITTDWDLTRSLVQGVSKKKDNVETVYKSCNSLKEANEYLDEIMAVALEKQTYETPSYEEVIANRQLPDDIEVEKEAKEVKQTKKNKKETEIKQNLDKQDEIKLSVDDAELLIEEDSDVFDKVIKESTKKPKLEKVEVIDETDILPQKEDILLLETEQVVAPIVKKEEKKEDKPKKKKDSIDLYQAYTFRSYDEKTNYLAYGYTLVKNGVTMKTESFVEKSKEPTFEGSRILGTMLAIEKGIDTFKKLVHGDENVIIMIHHLEDRLEETMLIDVPMDNGEYFFDWLRLLKEQYPNIKYDFSQIDLLFPEKMYIKLQVSVKQKLIKK